MLFPRSAAAVVAGVAALAGCGGLDAGEFASRADSICRDGQRDFARIQERPAGDARAYALQTEALLKVADAELAELRSLDPPGSVQPGWSDYLQARSRAVGFMRQGLEAAKSGDSKAFLAAQDRANDQTPKRAAAAEKAGLEVCGAGTVGLPGS